MKGDVHIVKIKTQDKKANIMTKLVPEVKFEYWHMLGSEVNKLFKILIKTSNAAKFIESDIQNIEAPRIDDPII